MKIAVVTLHREINFGSALQAVALTRTLNKMGHEAILIDYTRDGRTGVGALKYRYRTFRGSLPRRLLAVIEASVDLYCAWILRFRPFVRQASSLSRRYRSTAALRADPPDADVFMTGSDQVWNALYNLGVDAGFFLNFGPLTTRRLAYAASFGTEHIVKGTEHETRALLGRYSAIGIREAEGQRILNDLGLRSQVVVDPTLLLDRAEWLELVSDSGGPVPQRPYLLVYCVEDDRRTMVAEIATAVAQIRGLCVVQVAPGGRQDRIRGLAGPLRASPGQFLRLFADASYVVTSSFHGTAFSLTFEKQFVSVSPPMFAGRARTLLSAVGLEDRLVVNLADALALLAVDYDRVRPAIQILRRTSMAFLDGVLDADH